MSTRTESVGDQPGDKLSDSDVDRVLDAGLRVMEAEAKAVRRTKGLVIGAAVFVTVGMWAVWAVVILTGGYSVGDKQQLTTLILPLLTGLMGLLVGKFADSWKPHQTPPETPAHAVYAVPSIRLVKEEDRTGLLR